MSTADEEPTQRIVLDPPIPAAAGQENHALPSYDPNDPVDKADVIGEGAKAFAAWSGRFIIVVIALGLVGWGLSHVSGAIVPLMMALIVTSVLYPLTSGLKKLGVPYALGALLSLVTGVAVIGGLIGLIAPAVVSQWPMLAEQTVRGIRKIQNWASGPPLNLHDEQLDNWLQQFTSWLQGHSSDIVGFAVNIGGSVGTGVVTIVMTLVIVFFMLKDGHKFVDWVRIVVGRRGGFHVNELFTRMWNTLSGYIQAQAIVSFVDAVFIGLGLWFLDIPLAFPIAILTFLAGFIPIIGAFSAGAVAVLVALVAASFTHALIVLALVVVVQQVEGNVLQPVLQSRVMQLHPVVIILSVLLGGTWFGILGAFLAVPVAATLAVLLRYLGDMVDLRTGERTASQIDWATDDGVVVGGQSERHAAFFQNLVRGRLRSEEPAAAQPTVDVEEPRRSPITGIKTSLNKLMRRRRKSDDSAASR